MRIVRVTYELLRPVPLGELHVQTQVARPGKRVQLLEATLAAPDGTELVRARAVRVARAPLGAGTPVEEPPPDPEDIAPAPGPWGAEAFPGGAVEIRFASGAFNEPGPATAWFRLTVPRDRRRAADAASADGGRRRLPQRDQQRALLGRLALHQPRPDRLHRARAGREWIGLQAQTRIIEGESALAQAVLFDTEGRIGRSLQSLYVARAAQRRQGE